MKNLHKRFKLLYFLCDQLGVMEKQLTELSKRIDDNDPQAEEALNYFEDIIIQTLES